jgi:predicted membrane protein
MFHFIYYKNTIFHSSNHTPTSVSTFKIWTASLIIWFVAITSINHSEIYQMWIQLYHFSPDQNHGIFYYFSVQEYEIRIFFEGEYVFEREYEIRILKKQMFSRSKIYSCKIPLRQRTWGGEYHCKTPFFGEKRAYINQEASDYNLVQLVLPHT